jgi:hypothetical protein
VHLVHRLGEQMTLLFKNAVSIQAIEWSKMCWRIWAYCQILMVGKAFDISIGEMVQTIFISLRTGKIGHELRYVIFALAVGDRNDGIRQLARGEIYHNLKKRMGALLYQFVWGHLKAGLSFSGSH